MWPRRSSSPASSEGSRAARTSAPTIRSGTTSGSLRTPLPTARRMVLPGSSIGRSRSPAGRRASESTGGREGMPSTVALTVARYRPEKESEPTFQSYEIPFRKDWVVLDALNHVKDNLDGTLSFRWSCRMGVCGSCGMKVNGTPKLTCATFLSDYLPGPVRVEPLDYFAVVRDLVVDLTDFVRKLKQVKPWIIRKEEKPPAEGEYLQTPDQLDAYKQFSMCINCMLCYSACPIYGLESSFIGPAAIALAQRYNLDSRDQGAAERLEILSEHDGIWQCTFVGECTKVCPKHVDPAGAIQQYKLTAATRWVTSLLLQRGARSLSG